ncbi:MAG TPA: hypothetical protein VM537_14730 [Anaerolineae bacterium]|nr:hypothetical protein [Anaerolineae bacterium]
MANNADAIDLMNEVERLRAALEGQPVIKSEWEQKCEEVERLRAQVDTLTDVIERIGTTAEARIDEALAILEEDDHYMMAERAVKALKGEK